MIRCYKAVSIQPIIHFPLKRSRNISNSKRNNVIFWRRVTMYQTNRLTSDTTPHSPINLQLLKHSPKSFTSSHIKNLTIFWHIVKEEMGFQIPELCLSLNNIQNWVRAIQGLSVNSKIETIKCYH